MAWYRNHYHCGDCGTDWDDEWSCCCDDECPNCRSGDWSPVESDDLTFIVEPEKWELCHLRVAHDRGAHAKLRSGRPRT